MYRNCMITSIRCHEFNGQNQLNEIIDKINLDADFGCLLGTVER